MLHADWLFLHRSTHFRLMKTYKYSVEQTSKQASNWLNRISDHSARKYKISMCNACFQEQIELLESTGGECEQIICTHNVEEEETPQPPVKKRKRIIQTKIVNDVSTQTNDDNDDDDDVDIFPTMEEMLQPNVIAFGKVPV